MVSKIAVFFIAGLLITLGIAQGATIYVPDDYSTIQAAIDAASVGDTVIVKPGTYVENIDFLGKTITVKSDQGPEVTVIDGGEPANPDLGSVVIFNKNEGPESRLEGFGITNGSGTYHQWVYDLYSGGGIFCDGTAPTITGNIISGNEVSGGPDYLYVGGGIYCMIGSPTITYNTISDNIAGTEGGGILCQSASFPWIEGNTINNNWAERYGGGIECVFSCSPTIIDNSITQNTAFLYRGGGIVVSDDCSGIIKNNFISENSAGTRGGGILCEIDCTPEITHNTITYNLATVCGGGIRIRECSPLVANNTISYNTGAEFGGGISSYLGSSTFVNNIISYNTGIDYGGGISSYQGSSTFVNNIISNNIAGGGAGYDAGKCSPTMMNNVFYGNTATTTKGGAIWCGAYSSATITNSIFWNNEAPIGSNIWLGKTATPSTLTIDYCNVQGGQDSVYVDPGCTLIWGDGMFEADPQFEYPPGDDFHLKWTSPCINRGTNVGAPAEDMDGDLRPFVGTVDVGADEFTGTHPLEASVFEVSQASGGTVYLALAGDTMNAGRNYLLLGSCSGTVPGKALPGGLETLRVNWDWFTNLELLLLGTPIFQGFLGKMDVWGNAATQLNVPPLPTGTAGITMHYAYCCNSPFDFVSNPVAIEIVP
ncbi:MAG: right-handed parallel beta-helix repeat-containing protein [Planctomycetota bacterium]|jgi:predicted outer membrane repeat protein